MPNPKVCPVATMPLTLPDVPQVFDIGAVNASPAGPTTVPLLMPNAVANGLVSVSVMLAATLGMVDAGENATVIDGVAEIVKVAALVLVLLPLSAFSGMLTV